MRQHYRAHKLGIWNNLIPQLQKFAETSDSDGGAENVFQLTRDRNHSVRVALQVENPGMAPSMSSVVNNQGINVIENSKGRSKEPGVDQSSSEEQHNLIPDDGDIDYDEDEEVPEIWWYSTALSATIAVGCTLFLLNAILFASMYYKRNKRTGGKEGVDMEDDEDRQQIDLSAVGERISAKVRQLSDPQIVQDSIIEEGRRGLRVANHVQSAVHVDHRRLQHET